MTTAFRVSKKPFFWGLFCYADSGVSGYGIFFMEKMKHHSIYSIDAIAHNSRLKALSPGFKIIFALLSLAACLLSGNIFTPLFVTLSAAAISIAIGGTRPGEYLRLMSIPAAFLLCGSAAVALGFSRERIGQYCLDLRFFYIYTTNSGLMTAFKTAIKALGAVSSLYIITFSTPPGDIAEAMRRLHVPKLITELMVMIYRFIFILAQVHHELYTSAGSRLGYSDFWTSLRTFAATASSLFVISLKRAGTYYDALESRCYTGELLFLKDERRLEAKHIVFAAAYFVLVGTVMYIERRYL